MTTEQQELEPALTPVQRLGNADGSHPRDCKRRRLPPEGKKANSWPCSSSEKW